MALCYFSYSKQTKPKRTWLVETGWDKYARDNRMEEPVISYEIKNLAREQVQSYIKVLTWAEWKK
jgi:hypothetical protein